ncbi:MAG: O-antigen ligase family protein, partial [Saprospiraceae bacterium]
MNITVPSSKNLQLLWSWQSGAIGRTFNIYVFFLAYPFISIGNSLSFYIFLMLLFLLNRKGTATLVSFRHPQLWLFLIFGLIGVGSTIFSPLNQLGGAYLSSLKIVFQLAYWIILVMFIHTHAPKLNFYRMCKYLTIGSWMLVAQYFFFNGIKHLPLIVSSNRNTMIFTLLALIPFHVFYIQKRFGTKFVWPYLLFSIFVMLASEGRAGAILIMLQSFLIAALLLHKRFVFLAKFFFFGTLILFSLFYSTGNRLALARGLSSVSPRISEFVEGVGQGGDLTKDESWLTRRLMVEKGKEINEAYPWFGIGLLNFSLYEAQL